MSLSSLSNSTIRPANRQIFRMATWSLQAKLAGGALSALVVETILAALALTMFNQMNGMAVMPISDWQTALVIALWVTGGLCTLGFWFILHRDIVRPLRYITSHLELVALGDYSTPLLATNPDLIGEVTTRLDALRVEIAQIDAASQQTIERRVQILSGAIVVGQSLSSVQGTARVLQTGVEAVCSAFRQVHYARVYLPDNSTTEVLPGATAGQQTSEGRDSDAKRPISLTEINPISQVFITRRGALSRQTPETEATPAAQQPSSPMVGTRARCVLPLLIADQVAGVLDLQSIQEEAFTTSDLPLFQAVADQIAGALQNAELFEDLQTRLGEVELFNNRLTGRTWREYTLKRRAALPAGVDEVPNDPAAQTGAEQSAVWRQAISRNEVVEQVEGEQIRFAVPIRLSNTVLGAAEWVVTRESYTPATRQLAESLTARLALVADNIRLLDQSRSQTAREQLLNTISGKLMQQVNIEQILQTAVQELGQALQVSQAVIRLDEKLTRN